MTNWDDPNDPEEPDESDICPHGKGFDVACLACDREDNYEDETEGGDLDYVICPECGSDDVELVSNGDDGAEYECNDCGEVFTDGEEEDEI